MDFLSLFILRDRERERDHTPAGEGQREREREKIPSRLRAVSTEPDAGLKLTKCEIMTWAEVGRLTDGAIPGAPGD